MLDSNAEICEDMHGKLTFFPKSLVPSPLQALIRSPERLVQRDVDAARADETKMARVAKEVFILNSESSEMASSADV